MPVTLLSDFGTSDYFVGAMKGEILTRSPQATIVDITHEIPPQDVQTGAFMLLAAYRSFPAGTVHVAVVDPGVGSARRPILAVVNDQLFVGPDNGLFSFVYDKEPRVRVFHLNDERFFRTPVSTTFHGRDIFAPVGGALAAGAAPEEVGNEITDYVRLTPITPQRTPEGALRGTILHIDRFGNCVTNITREDLTEEMRTRGVRLRIADREVTSVHSHFAAGRAGEPFGIWGSAGYLEIAVNRGSAARTLDVQRGQALTLTAA